MTDVQKIEAIRRCWGWWGEKRTGEKNVLINGNALQIPLADRSVHCVITSPPFWGLRDYDVDNQIGLEPTTEQYIETMVQVFREVWRVLRDDGTCWLNLGDSYAQNGTPGLRRSGDHSRDCNCSYCSMDNLTRTVPNGLKPKDLCGIPWRVALALQADGWYLRSDIIWAKSNPMPESVTDRPTSAHEYVFLLAKQARYFYDAEAVRERSSGLSGGGFGKSDSKIRKDIGRPRPPDTGYRNRRSVWEIATESYKGAHYATFPTKLVSPCLLAGTSARGVCSACGAPWERVVEKIRKSLPVEERHGRTGHNGQPPQISGNYWTGLTTKSTGDFRPTCDHDAPTVPAVVLDPFCGSGTVGQVARETGRDFVGIDLSASYLAKNALPRAERKTAAAALAELPLFGGDQ